MANWKDLFNDEVCKCGKKGEYIVTAYNRIREFACEDHKDDHKKEQ